MENNDYIYLLKISTGSWDSFQEWIAAVFLNEFDANKVSETINKKIKEIKDGCPIKWNDDFSIEEENQYYKYFNNNFKLLGFNEAVVERKELYKNLSEESINNITDDIIKGL